MNDVVVDRVSREKFAEIETVCLFQELREAPKRSTLTLIELTRIGTHLDIGSVSSSISERHEHDTGDVDDLTINLEDTSSSLHLRFESMRGSTKPTREGVVSRSRSEDRKG